MSVSNAIAQGEYITLEKKFGEIYSITPDKDGLIWIANDPVIEYYSSAEDSTKTHLNEPYGKKSMILDSERNLWVAGERGIYKYDRKEWIFYSNADIGLSNAIVYDLAVDSQNHIWGAAERNIVQFDGSRWHVYNTSNASIPAANHFFREIEVDNEDNIWIGSLQDSVNLIRFDGNEWVHIQANDPEMGEGITALKIDLDNSVWVGRRRGGILHLKTSHKPVK